TDADSRCMKQGSGKGMDVSYNTQVVTEEKNKMIVDFETTNSGSDKGHLVEMGERAKDFLETEEINLLADTGYHNGKEMLEAEKSGITCVIPKGKAGNQTEDKGYSRDKFTYDENNDVYICPNNQTLKKMRDQKDSNGDSSHVYANYSACASCPHRAKCTKRKFREILRKPFQTEVDKLDKRFLKMKGEYKKRQEIIEHQFGTIKWVWGFDRYYTKGIDFADAENALRFTAYNLRRAINIMGVKRLIELAEAYLSVLFKSFFVELNVLYYCLFKKRKLSAVCSTISRSFCTV
ncbi:MAG: transposase, partial [Clostridia bacterium]|nr:transposase [Clostridia bacterium]